MKKHTRIVRTWFPSILVAITLLISPVVSTAAVQPTEMRADAVVLVNSSSPRYADFQHAIQPYLDHFGVPYTVIDVHTTPLDASIGNYALIIIGHAELDLAHADLSIAEQQAMVAAVNAGTGLVNWDGKLADVDNNGQYLYVQALFNFSYHTPGTDYGVAFLSTSGDSGITIDCTNDAHQDPVLAGTTDPMQLVETDGLWTEYTYPPRNVKAVFAALDEETLGLPVMRCYTSAIPNGTYNVVANLFTDGFGHDLTYHYSFGAANPKELSVATVGRTGGEDRFAEYQLGTVTVTDGTFSVYFKDADRRTVARAIDTDIYGMEHHRVPDQTWPFFGWSSVRLIPAGSPAPAMHYITERHEANDWVGTGAMPMPGIGPLPTHVIQIARSSSEPFLMAASHGEGRAVQWASYDWMYHSNKGAMYTLDDLVWRSLVWAARKPFVMQGMPPFVTMRVDDAAGPFDWVHVVNEFGIKPWAGLFYKNIDALEAADLSALTQAGLATASVHSKSQLDFYFNHAAGTNLTDDAVAINFADATAWHTGWNIPISKFVLPQYYEFGTNVFAGLQAWGVEFVGTNIQPGTLYGSPTPWLAGGPFRLYETGMSDSGLPFYYAGFLSMPGWGNSFFNCVSEIRDDAGYEWFPSNDVLGSVGRGTRQLRRGLDNMALPTLFTHSNYVTAISADNFRATLQGIMDNLAGYGVMPVTMEHACQYARAMHTSNITGAVYDPALQQITVNLGGTSDMPTTFYLFTREVGTIKQRPVDVPVFADAAQVTTSIQVTSSTLVYLPLVVRAQP